MEAELIQREKYPVSDTLIVELVVFRVPSPLRLSEHLYRYRLVLLENGKRVVGFDNERGKGDHMHIGQREEFYEFRSLAQLRKDFWMEVNKWIGS